MTNSIRFLALLGTILAFFLQAPSANAQATRTWVSGVGDDANPCSRTAPCKTFPGAISKTATGGEIDVLDPGGFGTVTITKAITLDGGGGIVGSLLAAGTNAVNVAAGTGFVILRNLRINGVGQGISGVSYTSGSGLLVENCDIFDFTSFGINIVPSAGNNNIIVQNSSINNNTAGGIQFKPSGGNTFGTVTGSFANSNGFGVNIDNTVGSGSVSVTVDHSSANQNVGNGASVSGPATTTNLLVSNSSLLYNSVGITVTSPASATSFQNNLIAQSTSGSNTVGTVGTNTLK